jgi:hypothetical protein
LRSQRLFAELIEQSLGAGRVHFERKLTVRAGQHLVLQAEGRLVHAVDHVLREEQAVIKQINVRKVRRSQFRKKAKSVAEYRVAAATNCPGPPAGLGFDSRRTSTGQMVGKKAPINGSRYP